MLVRNTGRLYDILTLKTQTPRTAGEGPAPLQTGVSEDHMKAPLRTPAKNLSHDALRRVRNLLRIPGFVEVQDHRTTKRRRASAHA
jgi:hypothetical protein